MRYVRIQAHPEKFTKSGVVGFTWLPLNVFLSYSQRSGAFPIVDGHTNQVFSKPKPQNLQHTPKGFI